MGLAPICSRFTASRLDDFGIDHSPPGVNRTLTYRLSGDCTTVVLQAGSAALWESNPVGQITVSRRLDERARQVPHGERSKRADGRTRTDNLRWEYREP